MNKRELQNYGSNRMRWLFSVSMDAERNEWVEMIEMMDLYPPLLSDRFESGGPVLYFPTCSLVRIPVSILVRISARVMCDTHSCGVSCAYEPFLHGFHVDFVVVLEGLGSAPSSLTLR